MVACLRHPGSARELWRFPMESTGGSVAPVCHRARLAERRFIAAIPAHNLYFSPIALAGSPNLDGRAALPIAEALGIAFDFRK